MVSSDEVLFAKSSCEQDRVTARPNLDDVSLTTVLNNGDFQQDSSIDCSLLSQNSSLPLSVSSSPGTVRFAISPSFPATSFGIGLRSIIGNSDLRQIFTITISPERSISILVREEEVIVEVDLNGAVEQLLSQSAAVSGEVIISYVANFNFDLHSCCIRSISGETCSSTGIDISNLLIRPIIASELILEQEISNEELILQQIVFIRDIDALITFQDSDGLNLGNVQQFEDLLPELEEVPLAIDDEDDDVDNGNEDGFDMGYLVAVIVLSTLLLLTGLVYITKYMSLRNVIKEQNSIYGFEQ